MTPGLFDSAAMPAPARRQEAVFRKALERRRDTWPHGGREKGYEYRGAGDLLLRHGKFSTGRELPEAYRHHRGAPGRCFQNAIAAVSSDPTLRYVEGVYTTGAGHPTSHAWCIDPDGGLLELTYPTEAEELARGLDSHTMMSSPPPASWSYWGCVFHLDYVLAVQAAQEMPVLDRPTQDAAYEDCAEHRRDFPVYRYPYDANRRSI